MDCSTTLDVVYGRKFGMALVLDVLRPARASGAGVIALSSGGWNSYPEVGKPQPDEFLKRGMTVFIVMHGGRPRFAIPEIVRDIRRAIRFVRAEAETFGIDRQRLGIFGISSGGNISLLTAAQGGPGDPEAADVVDRQSDHVGAAACFYPPTDFANYGRPGNVRLPYRAVGETEDDATLARDCSPVTHFSATMPPTFIIHGDADELVPVQQCHAADARLTELGVEHRIEIQPGKAHGWPDMAGEYARCADWLDSHLATGA